MNTSIGFDALFEFATEGILVTNQAGEIIRINRSAERMFGYEKDELLGQKIEVLIPRRLAASHVRHREGFDRHPTSRAMGQDIDLNGQRKDGTELPVEISLSPFESEQGRFVIAFIIDITIRKQQKEALQKTNRALQFYAEELKASNAELENFAYISSHDLQEPLRKIRSFGDRLKITDGGKLSAQGADYLERMLSASIRMQDLINDLLAFSRLSSRAQPIQAIDLNRVLREVLSDMEVSISETQAQIEADPLPLMQAEPMQMRQLFQNLISNAIKFRKEDEIPVIKIQSRTVENAGLEYTELSFVDNGIGFDEKYNDRIFNIFQRLEGRKYEGSGIGLAICRKIALRHGGNITARSQPGQGSAFIITLANHQTENQLI